MDDDHLSSVNTLSWNFLVYLEHALPSVKKAEQANGLSTNIIACLYGHYIFDKPIIVLNFFSCDVQWVPVGYHGNLKKRRRKHPVCTPCEASFVCG
jgi:hypothetical protein